MVFRYEVPSDPEYHPWDEDVYLPKHSQWKSTKCRYRNIPIPYMDCMGMNLQVSQLEAIEIGKSAQFSCPKIFVE